MAAKYSSSVSHITDNRHIFKVPKCDIVSPLDVVILLCMYTKTNRLPAGTQKPPV